MLGVFELFRKLLSGIVFGAGFTISMILVLFAFTYISSPSIFRGDTALTDAVPELPRQAYAPSIESTDKPFLGTSGSYTSSFNWNGDVLSSGGGEIVGQATLDGEPLKGLKLRLSLNGSIKSQWVETGEEGLYRLSVPYGEYRIDGYDLDHESANTVLAGKIDAPSHESSSQEFMVGQDIQGLGINLSFVTPIEKSSNYGVYQKGDSFDVSWEPYPEAESYTVQIYIKESPNGFARGAILPPGDEITTTDTKIDLGSVSDQLIPGFYYNVGVRAYSKYGSAISDTAQNYRGVDFKIEPPPNNAVNSDG